MKMEKWWSGTGGGKGNPKTSERKLFSDTFSIRNPS
jgi:hypothetical protein